MNERNVMIQVPWLPRRGAGEAGAPLSLPPLPSQVDHPFVLKLEATFRDRDCLYMLLEYVQVSPRPAPRPPADGGGMLATHASARRLPLQGGELFAFLANTKLGYVALDDAR